MYYFDRVLTEKQHASLDRADKEDPSAIVIGWDSKNEGPIVEMSDGRTFTSSRMGSRTNRNY